MKLFKRVLSAITVLSILLTMSVFTLAQSNLSFTDTETHWAKQGIEKWASAEILNGYTDGSFKPDTNITRAEFAAIINRIMKYSNTSTSAFTDVPETEWYAADVNKLSAAAIIQGDGNGHFLPNQNITRQEAILVLARAFEIPATNSDAYTEFADADKIASWATTATSALKEKGYVLGKPGSLLDPLGNLTRAEATQLMTNIIDTLIHVSGEYNQNTDGDTVVSTAPVTIKDNTIKGNLYIAPGVNAGDITLNNVIIEGKIIVLGKAVSVK